MFACYKPVATGEAEPDAAADLAPDTWLKLLKLAHDDKKTAFKLYAQHYLGTDGNCYWSDTMQLSTYIPSYAEFLQSARGADGASAAKETLVIGEHYVPRHAIMAFMARARDILRAHGSEVIYGTIRAILRDTVSFLPWAKDDFACVIFNIRTPHTGAGIAAHRRYVPRPDRRVTRSSAAASSSPTIAMRRRRRWRRAIRAFASFSRKRRPTTRTRSSPAIGIGTTRTSVFGDFCNCARIPPSHAALAISRSPALAR